MITVHLSTTVTLLEVLQTAPERGNRLDTLTVKHTHASNTVIPSCLYSHPQNFGVLSQQKLQAVVLLTVVLFIAVPIVATIRKVKKGVLEGALSVQTSHGERQGTHTKQA